MEPRCSSEVPWQQSGSAVPLPAPQPAPSPKPPGIQETERGVGVVALGGPAQQGDGSHSQRFGGSDLPVTPPPPEMGMGPPVSVRV